jgi:hypothetical protein
VRWGCVAKIANAERFAIRRALCPRGGIRTGNTVRVTLRDLSQLKIRYSFDKGAWFQLYRQQASVAQRPVGAPTCDAERNMDIGAGSFRSRETPICPDCGTFKYLKRYRIRSAYEPPDRVVKESDLDHST